MLSVTERPNATILLSVNELKISQPKHMELGDLIRSERKKAGWSQRVLAKSLGVSPGAVAQWELGTSRPTLPRLIDMCALFGISIQSFLQPGSPYLGEIVEDPEELALLTTWRRLSKPEQAFMLRMLRNAGLAPESDVDNPKPSREHA